jgi:hypothetical protein
MSARSPLAAIVVPTHDHAHTLDLAVASALEQTVAEIEVIVVGDGVGDDTREVAAGLARDDSRVRFLDLPKGPHHGEVHRGRAIEETSAEIVCYLCDDDLLLADHVESMAALLADADLAHSQNGHLDVDGSWQHYYADLARLAWREWMLRPGNNVVSLTGTAHTVAAYRRLPHGWRTTPPGHWVDHHMWQQFLAEPWVRAVTAPRITAIQLPSHLGGREEWNPEARRAELLRWRSTLASAEGRAEFQESARRSLVTQATAEYPQREALEKRLASTGRALAGAEQARDEALSELIAANTHVANVEATRTWRLRSRLRRLLRMRV